MDRNEDVHHDIHDSSDAAEAPATVITPLKLSVVESGDIEDNAYITTAYRFGDKNLQLYGPRREALHVRIDDEDFAIDYHIKVYRSPGPEHKGEMIIAIGCEHYTLHEWLNVNYNWSQVRRYAHTLTRRKGMSMEDAEATLRRTFEEGVVFADTMLKAFEPSPSERPRRAPLSDAARERKNKAARDKRAAAKKTTRHVKAKKGRHVAVKKGAKSTARKRSRAR